MKKLILFFAFFCLLPLSARAAGECEELIIKAKLPLIATIDLALHKAMKAEPGTLGVYRKFKKNLMRRSVYRQCMRHGCTQIEIDALVKETIEKSLIGRNGRNLFFWSSGVVTFSFISTMVTVAINPQAHFTVSFIQQLLGYTTLVTAGLLSPFATPLSAKVEKFAAQAQTTVNNMLDLEAQAVQIRKTFNLQDQHVISRTYEYRNFLWLNLRSAHEALEKKDLDSVAYILADTAVQGFRHWKDIPLEHPTVQSAIYAAFVQSGVSEATQISSKARVIIEKLDPEFAEPAADSYYSRALSYFTGPGLNFFQK